MKKLLVTGVSGFVGRNLLRVLADDQRYAITGIDRRPRSDQGTAGMDLCDAAAVRKLVHRLRPDAIMHLASLSNPTRSKKQPVQSLLNNVTGTLNLLESIQGLRKRPKTLLVGSFSQYRYQPGNTAVSERHQLLPHTPYAISKQTQEYAGLYYQREYGLPVYLTRSLNHFGPFQNDDFVVGSICSQAARIMTASRMLERTVTIGDPDLCCAFLYVDDAIRAYAAILERGTAGDIYNVCGDRPVRISELVDCINRLYGLKLKIKRITFWRRVHEPRQLTGSNRKLKRTTGWRQRVSIEEGLRRTIEWWRHRRMT